MIDPSPILAALLLVGAACPAQQRFFSGKPEKVALGTPTGFRDYTLALDLDELQLVFGSTRPGGSGGLDLWIATRGQWGDPWTTQRPLGELNTAADEYAPTLSSDGLELYFASTRGGLTRIWRATRASAASLVFGAPQELRMTSAPNAHVTDPMLTRDDTRLFYASSETGGGDLYLVTRQRQGSGWTRWGGKTRLLPASHPQDEDRAPMPDANGFLVWFTRRVGSSYDHWMVWRDSASSVWSAPAAVSELNTSGWNSHLTRGPSSMLVYATSGLNLPDELICICENGPSLPAPDTPTTGLLGAAYASSDRPVDFVRQVDWQLGQVNRAGFYQWNRDQPTLVWAALLGTELPAPVKLSPLGGLWRVSPVFLLTLPATSRPDTLSVSVPNDPGLRGLRVWLQGLGLAANRTGAFTPATQPTIR